MGIQDFIQKEFLKKTTNKFNDIFIGGLERKGFYFKNFQEAAGFVEENCICKDNLQTQERIYYVNEIPFLIWSYKPSDFEFTNDIDNISITANFGTYSYL